MGPLPCSVFGPGLCVRFRVAPGNHFGSILHLAYTGALQCQASAIKQPTNNPLFLAPQQSSGPAERQRGGLGIGEGLIGPVLRSGIQNPPLTSFPAWARARPPIGVLRAPPPVHDTNIVVSMARSGGTREYSLGWIQPPGLGRARPSLEDREPWHEFAPPLRRGADLGF